MLDHPNIISYFDSFEEDGVLMIEMEYADGGSVHRLLFFFGLTFIWVRTCVREMVGQSTFLPLKMIIF